MIEQMKEQFNNWIDLEKVGRLAITNRGEIAARVARTASQLGIEPIGVRADDEKDAGHCRQMAHCITLPGTGVAAYLDINALCTAVVATGCQAVHPGYGFLSENWEYAEAIAQAGLTWLGPEAKTLKMLGNKIAARTLAYDAGVPVLLGSEILPSSEEGVRWVQDQQNEHLPWVVKAAWGGGGRGIRMLNAGILGAGQQSAAKQAPTQAFEQQLKQAWGSVHREATRAFGSGDLFLEAQATQVRHIEVQIAGDGSGAIHILGDRDCSLQRRHQKLIEFAPAPHLSSTLRLHLHEAARRIGAAASYQGLATVEFLVSNTAPLPVKLCPSPSDTPVGSHEQFAFLEVNPRIQVEHTVTEESLQIDLVALQIALACGAKIADLQTALPIESDLAAGKAQAAVQFRINAEKMLSDGTPQPAQGKIDALTWPTGPFLRVDTAIQSGDGIEPQFDSLIAKIIVHAKDWHELAHQAQSALDSTTIEGVDTNLELHQTIWPNLIQAFEAQADWPTTDWLAEQIASLAPQLPDKVANSEELPQQSGTITSHLQGTVIQVLIQLGQVAHAGQEAIIVDSMKMEHVIAIALSGEIKEVMVQVDQTIVPGQPLFRMVEMPQQQARQQADNSEAVLELDLSTIRPDLTEVLERKQQGTDAHRPQAVQKRHAKGYRTARENIEDLCDAGSFIEYGSLTIAAQRRRRELDDLIANTPADGMVTGIGTVNGQHHSAQQSKCVLMSYDYTVLAGTQGKLNHYKKDRMFELAKRHNMPVILYAEGGGGRPGDTDTLGVAGLDCLAFFYFGALSGKVPLIGVVNGYCFAGNAALLGACDIIIATESSNIGMGGPAMIEGGGLGQFSPQEVGPIDVHSTSGSIDMVVEDEAQATQAAKDCLSYFQGQREDWQADDQRRLRHAIPENRLRVYPVRPLIHTLCDLSSVTELRANYGLGMVTCLARIEGKPIGVIANNPEHLSGAIDTDAAIKAADFMKLCDSHGIPLLFLCDTPGFMVGPAVEATGLMRKAGQLFTIGGNVKVPCFTVVLRKGYGLGAQAMAAGSFKAPVFHHQLANWRIWRDGLGGIGQVGLSQRTRSD